MDLRTELCVALSLKLLKPPSDRTVDYSRYEAWRMESLTRSWSAFSDSAVRGKDVLDFGCGDGPLALFLASNKHPKSIVGVDISESGIVRARANAARSLVPSEVSVSFMLGSVNTLPFQDCSFDTLLAFDCMEHVMSPRAILHEWHRVLRPGGRCLIEWFPFKGPWGPHMEALIPIPWAHIVFGERAMFRAAARIYDSPRFSPRHWDLDDAGLKKPNKWKAWTSFKEQGYVNELDIATFVRLATDVDFQISRFEARGFGGAHWRQLAGKALKSLPFIGEYFVSHAVIELSRPE